MKDSLIYITQRLLKKNKISFDKKEFSFQIQSHPSYPSLHAITGVLDHFNIENIAADVPVNSETLAQLPNNFLAQIYLDNNGKDLVFVEKDKKTKDYNILSKDNEKETVSQEQFLQKFTGIIVAVENEKSESKTVKTSNTKEILLFVYLQSRFFIALFYQRPLLINLVHTVLSILGIIISLVILKQENGEKTSIGNAFCSGNTEKKDCDAVLTSKGANLFKGHKLSDLSLLYFSGLTLTSLLLTANFYTIHLISILASIITLYSIYYQYAIIKKWCLLCLTIVGILWVQSVISYSNIESSNLITVYSIAIFILSYTIVYTIWNYLKPIFIQQKDLQKNKIAYLKFKRNYTLFDSLLQRSATLDTNIDNLQEIIFGNASSKLELLIVTNPFCGHCKPVHTIIEDILKQHGNNVRIIVRFNTNVDHLESNQIKVTSRLVELYNTQGPEICRQAMSAIYIGENVEKWIQTWGVTNNLKASLSVLNTEKEWCTNNGINFTPEILINGKAYPKEYERKDLLFFIEDLEESYNTESVLTY